MHKYIFQSVTFVSNKLLNRINLLLFVFHDLWCLPFREIMVIKEVFIVGPSFENAIIFRKFRFQIGMFPLSYLTEIRHRLISNSYNLCLQGECDIIRRTTFSIRNKVAMLLRPQIFSSDKYVITIL